MLAMKVLSLVTYYNGTPHFAKKGKESLYNIFIMDETQIILGAGCAASTKLIEKNGKITRIHNYKFPYEYINRFDELMKKKELIYQIYGEK